MLAPLVCHAGVGMDAVEVFGADKSIYSQLDMLSSSGLATPVPPELFNYSPPMPSHRT